MSALSPTLQVALPRPLLQVFDYLPPDGIEAAEVARGSRVRVPFGRGEAIGIVSGHGESGDPAGLKQAAAVLDAMPLLQGESWDTLAWLARYLHAPFGEVLATALPSPLRAGEPLPDTTRHGWRLTEAGHTALPALRPGKPRALAARLGAGIRSEDLLDADGPGWREPMRSLARRALVERVAMDDADPASPPAAALVLNDCLLYTSPSPRD